MNGKKTIFLFGAVTALAVLSFAGFEVENIIAEDEDSGHTFSEDTDITALFSFRDGQELVTFEVFNQESGWDADDAVVFDLQGIVGTSPLLHEAADDARKYSRDNISHEFGNRNFDVDVIIAQGADVKRVFVYEDCRVTDYGVKTMFDKEEGWTTSKGFAVTDNYEFTCDGYEQENPVYDAMNKDKKANTVSSLDLKEPFYTWSDHFKYTKQSP